MAKKYYINVELRDYDDKIVGYSTCNLDTDISNQAIIDAARVAASIMVKHYSGIRIEQEKQAEELERQIANLPNSEL